MENLDKLLEKYLNGQTSLQEEEWLRNYFTKEDIPGGKEEYKALFGYFNKEIQDREKQLKQPKMFSRFFSVIGTGIAACFFLFIGIKLFFHPTPNEPASVVYINGKAYRDVETIHKNALNTLELFSEQSDEIISDQINALESFWE
jgi:hypothetical protein